MRKLIIMEVTVIAMGMTKNAIADGGYEIKTTASEVAYLVKDAPEPVLLAPTIVES